ncbi:MAG: NADPH:quinone oxidoreductase family protein [Pseudolabrys sp.]|nr:NADPH:quinone oxidoreductase family protein [Pseudolabrys sp.]MDP2293886.1 NADPH:quinone oxidoreductase family protein [Pseudolabrys sp.]
MIDVKAAEVNYPDILVITGQYQVKPPLPFAPGKAAAGIVSAVGDGVTDLTVGDRVTAQVEYGAFAQMLRAPVVNVYRMPDGMDFAKGAALGLVYQTAHFALVERARMAKGDRVLVLGASGGIGVASVQLAKALGAGTVIAGVLGPDNVEIARNSGADVVIDLGSINLREDLRTAVHAATDGHGADVVIDPVGGAANAGALRAMAWRGRMVIIGFASGDIPTIKANYLLVKNIEVSGLQWSDYRDRTPDWVRRVQEEIFALHIEGKLNPVISRKFPLEGFADALSLLRDGKAQGKLILEVG